MVRVHNLKRMSALRKPKEWGSQIVRMYSTLRLLTWQETLHGTSTYPICHALLPPIPQPSPVATTTTTVVIILSPPAPLTPSFIRRSLVRLFQYYNAISAGAYIQCHPPHLLDDYRWLLQIVKTRLKRRRRLPDRSLYCGTEQLNC